MKTTVEIVDANEKEWQNRTTTYTLAKRKNAFGEWVARCYINGKRYEFGDVFETTREDMAATVNAFMQIEYSRQNALTCVPN